MHRHRFAAAFAAMLLAASATAPAARAQIPYASPLGPIGAFDFQSFDGSYVSLWTEDAVTGIELDGTNTIPLVVPPTRVEDLIEPSLFVWDGWPLRNEDGSVAVIDGWVVWIALSAPREPNEDGPAFYTIAEWSYWYTRDGVWLPGGRVFERDTALGSRQWAGSASYDPATGMATFWYTAVGVVPGGNPPENPDQFPQGDPAAGRPPINQQIAAVSARVVADDAGLRFTDYTDHELLLIADGVYYQTVDAAIEDQVIYGFRDPWYYREPGTGDEYLLFTANSAPRPGPHNGVVGVARKTSTGDWELLPPILEAAGTSSQLERPHLLEQDGLIYLFFCTHSFTFSPAGAGPEGLYGFVTDSGSFRGLYVPLNGTGLVAGNPEIAPNQLYSFAVLPGGYVSSYINQTNFPDYEAGWVGAPSPFFQIELDGATSRVSQAITSFVPEPGALAGGLTALAALAYASPRRRRP